jgi:hypothetical protein
VAIPAESYPRYSSRLSASKIGAAAGFRPTKPTIPHIFFLLRSIYRPLREAQEQVAPEYKDRTISLAIDAAALAASRRQASFAGYRIGTVIEEVLITEIANVEHSQNMQVPNSENRA